MTFISPSFTFKNPSISFKTPSVSLRFQGFTAAMKAAVDKQPINNAHSLANLIPIFAESEPGYPTHKLMAEKILTKTLEGFLAPVRQGRPLDEYYRNQIVAFFKGLKPIRYSPAEGSDLEKLMIEALEACQVNLIHLNS